MAYKMANRPFNLMRQVPDSSTAPRTSYCRDGQVPSPSWGWAPSWNEFSPPAFYATRTPSPEVAVSYPHPPLMPHSPRLTSSQLPGERESVWNNSNYSRATTGFYFIGTENVNSRTYGHMTSQMCNSERVEASGRTSGSETHEFESVLSIVMKQVNEEIRSTCDILGIHPNPCEWSMGDVRAWILWTSRQCGLNGIVLDLFNMDGATLSSLSPDGFRQRAPQGGDTLHAKLDIWRSAYQQTASTTITCLSSVSSPTATVNSGRTSQDAYKQQVEVAVSNKQQQQTEEVFSIGQMLNWMNNTQDAYCSTTTLDSQQHSSLLNGPSQSCSFSCSSVVTHQQQQQQLQQQPMYAQQPTTSPYSEMNASESDAGTEDVTSADDIDDDDSLPEDEGVKGHSRSSNQNSSSSSSGGGSGGGGSHIHLWQFLKELLAHPQENGTAIRWLDRQRGVFKIEDSVRVARLWGKRKNRPAMNYDKLSRSIRQYYRKGIMRKTERSQRLVYQFCHPYAL